MHRTFSVAQEPLASDAEVELADVHPTDYSNVAFLHNTLGQPPRMFYTSRDTIMTVDCGAQHQPYMAPGASTTSLGFRALHSAASGAFGISLRPEVMWYVILSSVMAHLRQYRDRYQHLFTRAITGDYELSTKEISLEQTEMEENAPKALYWMLDGAFGNEALELLVPSFTGSTVEDYAAMALALTNPVIHHQPYRAMPTGTIGDIRVVGSPRDWYTISNLVVRLLSMYAGLDSYLAGLLPVVDQIAGTVAQTDGRVDTDFWSSMYRYMETPDGHVVDGWFNQLLAQLCTPRGLVERQRFTSSINPSEVPSHLHTVPFVAHSKNVDHRLSFFGGIIAVDFDDYFEPRLGIGIAEA